MAGELRGERAEGLLPLGGTTETARIALLVLPRSFADPLWAGVEHRSDAAAAGGNRGANAGSLTHPGDQVGGTVEEARPAPAHAELARAKEDVVVEGIIHKDIPHRKRLKIKARSAEAGGELGIEAQVRLGAAVYRHGGGHGVPGAHLQQVAGGAVLGGVTAGPLVIAKTDPGIGGDVAPDAGGGSGEGIDINGAALGGRHLRRLSRGWIGRVTVVVGVLAVLGVVLGVGATTHLVGFVEEVIQVLGGKRHKRGGEKRGDQAEKAHA